MNAGVIHLHDYMDNMTVASSGAALGLEPDTEAGKIKRAERLLACGILIGGANVTRFVNRAEELHKAVIGKEAYADKVKTQFQVRHHRNLSSL